MSVISKAEKSSAESGEKVFQHFWRARVLFLSGHADADDVQEDGDADQRRRVAEESYCKKQALLLDKTRYSIIR